MAEHHPALRKKAERAALEAWLTRARDHVVARAPEHAAAVARAVLDAVVEPIANNAADAARALAESEWKDRAEQAEAERDDVKTANTAVRVAAERAARKGYDLDPHEVLDLLGGDGS